MERAVNDFAHRFESSKDSLGGDISRHSNEYSSHGFMDQNGAKKLSDRETFQYSDLSTQSSPAHTLRRFPAYSQTADTLDKYPSEEHLDRRPQYQESRPSHQSGYSDQSPFSERSEYSQQLHQLIERKTEDKPEKSKTPKTSFTDIFKQSPGKVSSLLTEDRILKPITKASFTDIIKSASTTTERHSQSHLTERPMVGIQILAQKPVVKTQRLAQRLTSQQSAKERVKEARRIVDGVRRNSVLEERMQRYRQEVYGEAGGRGDYRPITARSVGDSQEGGSHHTGHGLSPPVPHDQSSIQSAVAAGAAAYRHAGYEQPKRLSFQIHGQEGPHSYRFGYDTGIGYNRQFRYEERDNYGVLHGRYGYYDQSGKLQIVNYSADPKLGFRAEGENVPKPQFRR